MAAGCGDGDQLDYDPITGGHDELLADYVEHFHLGSKWVRALGHDVLPDLGIDEDDGDVAYSLPAAHV